MASSRGRKARAREVAARLAQAFPGTATELCALEHVDPFQLLVATILSAQCTDARVNTVTPALFARYPDARALAGADPQELEELVRSTGFFRSKTRNLLGMAHGVVTRYDGEVPSDMEDLVSLDGVGRKTANVVRSVAFGLPGLPVDTHVGRLARRLGLTDHDDPVKVEHDLGALVPPEERGAMSLRLILHGRATCTARSPHCGECILVDLCPSARVVPPPARTAVGAPPARTAGGARSARTTGVARSDRTTGVARSDRGARGARSTRTAGGAGPAPSAPSRRDGRRRGSS